jgi:hypothetical protein
MEVTFSTETFVDFERTIKCCIPGGRILDILDLEEWPRFLLNHCYIPVTAIKWMDIREISNISHGLVRVKRIRGTRVQTYLEAEHN